MGVKMGAKIRGCRCKQWGLQAGADAFQADGASSILVTRSTSPPFPNRHVKPCFPQNINDSALPLRARFRVEPIKSEPLDTLKPVRNGCQNGCQKFLVPISIVGAPRG